MLGSVDLVLLPYGTALGVYALWVLLNEDGKALFDDCSFGRSPITCEWSTAFASRVVHRVPASTVRSARSGDAFQPPRTTPSRAITVSA